jgi:tRNA pseudouridine38-40 synthase
MRMLKLHIEYDGSEFVGWQMQHNGRSVQGVLEQALSKVLQEEVHIVGAGRTDAGVHAKGQVAHCPTSTKMDLARLRRSANALLPDDVVIKDIEEASERFHARYGAVSRRYRYWISRVPVSLTRSFCWYLGYQFDLDRMNQCAGLLVGEKDFKGFSKTGANVKHHRCIVSRAAWTAEGDMISFEIVANRFLYGMVRALVGTMVDVGRGKKTVDDFTRILEPGDHGTASMAAPAKGLILEEVLYAGEEGRLRVPEVDLEEAEE